MPALPIPAHPIRQTLNALPGLNRTAKAVLIEVCELAENGGKGGCNAKNEYLVSRLGGTERTVSRALTLLESYGLLVSQGLGKARVLVATPALRACYAGATEADRRVAAFALNLASRPAAEPRQTAAANLDKSGHEPRQSVYVEQPLNLDKSGHEPRQKWSTNLDKSGHEPRQKWSRVYGDDQNDQLNEQDDHIKTLRAALASAEKKIEEQAFEIDRLAALLQAANGAADASHTRAATDVPTVKRAAPKIKAGEPEHFPAFWAVWPRREARADAVKAFAKLSADDQAAAASRADTWFAARPDLLQPERARFVPHAATWLSQARWTDEAPCLLPFAPFSPSHAHASANPLHRSTNGAKPTANAGKLARALFSRLAE